MTLSQRFWKRAGDIIFSALALIVASPFMAIIALAIHFQDKGPVFYCQNRVTRDGKVFSLLKFRSMIVDAEKNGVTPATGKDPRITKVGAFLRATRMDELPQLINILKGEMSIVGPRPERVEHVEKYGREISEWHFREKVKGGLTGYAQIYGRYNTSAYDKLRMDLIYIENYSAIMDVKLILMTLRVLFSKESTEGFEVQKQREAQRKTMLSEEKETWNVQTPSAKDQVNGAMSETRSTDIEPNRKNRVENVQSTAYSSEARVIGETANSSNLAEVFCTEAKVVASSEIAVNDQTSVTTSAAESQNATDMSQMKVTGNQEHS